MFKKRRARKKPGKKKGGEKKKSELSDRDRDNQLILKGELGDIKTCGYSLACRHRGQWEIRCVFREEFHRQSVSTSSLSSFWSLGPSGSRPWGPSASRSVARVASTAPARLLGPIFLSLLLGHRISRDVRLHCCPVALPSSVAFRYLPADPRATARWHRQTVPIRMKVPTD